MAVNQRIVNDTALSISRKVLGVIRRCLRDEEAGDAFKEFFEIAKAEVAKALAASAHQQERLRPLEGRP